MATTEARVRKYLDPEEPNYSAAAAELGAEALPVLEALVQGADPLLASKAAYLASLIPDARADRVVEQAARSEHPTVRVAAAAGLRSRPETAVDMATELLADPDAGVRKVAARTTRGRATAATTRSKEGPEDAPHERDRSGPSAGSGAVKQVQILEGEHGGGFPPGTADEAERAEGQGGGDAGNTRARLALEAAGAEAESGGGGDVGGSGATGGSRSGDGPDGGGQITGDARGAGDSQYGGGGV